MILIIDTLLKYLPIMNNIKLKILD